MFANTTFWIAQRVPSRTHYISVVKTHGGNVTNLEKQADFLIADHVHHRDAPPGALSYQFLEECAKQGQLLPPDDRAAHLCGPKPGSVREVADASRAPKAHRTAFTPGDDDIIREWVKDAVRRGESHAGNEIWKDLERQNKRHTWQSWRDRWVKKLRDGMPPQWDTEIRGLDADVDELVKDVLEEEAESEALQREEQESQIKERKEEEEQRGPDQQKEIEKQRERSEQEEEGQSEIMGKTKSEREKDKVSKRGNGSLPLPGVENPKAQRTSTQPRAVPEIAQAALRREQDRLLSGGTGSMVNSAASPQHRPAPVVLSRVAQAKLMGENPRPHVQSMLSSLPVPTKATNAYSRPCSESEHSEAARPEFARGQSGGVSSNRAKRPKNHHIVAAANEEEENRMEPRAVETPANEAFAPSGRGPSLPRPFTAEDFLQLYEKIDAMNTDTDGLRIGLEAFAPSTDFSPQQWLQFLKDDVLPILKNMILKHNGVAACLTEYIQRNPHQPWGRWRSHYGSGTCSILKDGIGPNTPSDSQTSQINDARPQTPKKKRARDDIEDSPQFKSPKVAETANISRQRVDINLQSTLSGASQAESIRAIDDGEDDDDDFTKALQTQAILAADTQPLDLCIPDLDEALDSSIAQSIESDKPDDFDRQCRASLRDQELINQQLLDNPGENGAMDLDFFDLPEPDGGFEATDAPDEGIDTQLLKDTQAMATGTIEDLNKEEIDEAASQASLDFDALANQLMERGHSPENILTAIQVTSANMPLMLVVLEHLKMGMKVPVHTRGIWTEQDDEDVLGGDARKLERVEAKHGWDGEGGCKARQYFLRDSMAAVEELTRQSNHTA
ncbi:Myb-DNA-bind-2 multi-domain protein [Venturia nashicola]|uniref:DNA-binding protein RAP1 n=1 Tax=Venturia nashicola TaxID=86259 RepID=A0A4Z1NX06_9PEZI|nr:Myb-DNA-bind-2 multi-domain protein [Venturia nashicola]TLD32326.1 Myb-DNA-bind-2 multi-domain protein [Venturia nashicola]